MWRANLNLPVKAAEGILVNQSIQENAENQLLTHKKNCYNASLDYFGLQKWSLFPATTKPLLDAVFSTEPSPTQQA